MGIHKPLALVARWNKDLSITLYCRGRKVARYETGSLGAKESAEAFISGWFGDHPKRVRWVFA